MFINVPDFIAKASGVPAEAKLLLGFLKGFADNGKRFFGGRKYLSELLGTNPQLLEIIIDACKKHKIIKEDERGIDVISVDVFNTESYLGMFTEEFLNFSLLKEFTILNELGLSPHFDKFGDIIVKFDDKQIKVKKDGKSVIHQRDSERETGRNSVCA